jgi:GNAT superfamily N-acetyltransferase
VTAVYPGDSRVIDVLRTRDGELLTVRPIEPADKAELERHLQHLGERSRYQRFLRPIRQLTERDLAYFTELDHRDHEGLIAETPEGDPIGVARYIRLPDRPGVAEMAMAITDDWQGRGVGTALLRILAERARTADVRSFLGICLTENFDMQQLLRQLGPSSTTKPLRDGTVEVEVQL